MNDNTSKKQISINMLANIVSYSTNAGIAFLLTPFLIDKLGKETYSFYPIANTIVSYMSILTNALNAVASRFVTVEIVKENKSEADKYFSSTLAANLIMSCILALPMALIVIFLDKIMDVPINEVASIKMLFSLVFTAAIMNICASVFGIATFAKNRIDLRSLRELVTAIIKVILFVTLYKFFSPTIFYVGVVALAVAIVNVCFQIGYTKYLLPDIHLSRSNISLSHTKKLLGSSTWNAINSFGNVMLAGMTLILANIIFGANSSGTFSIVYTVPQFMSGIISMLVGVFFPVMTYRYAQKDKDGLCYEIATSQKLIGSIGCAIIATFGAFSQPFFQLWTPSENSIVLSKLTILVLVPYIFISCFWTLTNIIIVVDKLKFPAIANLVLGILNIVLSFMAKWLFGLADICLPIISGILQIVWIGVIIPKYISNILKIKPWNVYTPFIWLALCTTITTALIRQLTLVLHINNWGRFILYGGITGIIVLVIFISISFGKRPDVLIRTYLKREK